MSGDEEKQRRAVLGCFRSDPSFEGLWRLAAAAGRAPMLRWIDESGLALYLLCQLRKYDVLGKLNSPLCAALLEREEANRRRTSLLLTEFARIADALQRTSARYAIIKGFSLTNEFCAEPWMRHQCDTDLLVAPGSVSSAKATLISLGYQVESEDASGEICMAIRSAHVPSAADFLYSPPPHWHVELHPLFYEPTGGVSFRIGEDWAENLEWREIEGIRYQGLTRAYRFLGQVLHAFRHISAWVRLSWIYEIACFIERFRADEAFWAKIDDLTRDDIKIRNACGVVCSMVKDAFGTDLPERLRRNWVDSMSSRQRLWVDHYAARMLLNDFTSGDKVGLLLQREFADSEWTWWKFRLSRYRKLLRAVPRGGSSGPLFIAERARRHANYLWGVLRWNFEGKLRAAGRGMRGEH